MSPATPLSPAGEWVGGGDPDASAADLLAAAAAAAAAAAVPTTARRRPRAEPPTAAPVVSVRRAKARGAVLAAMAAEGRLEERLADLMLALRECFGCEHAVCVLRRGGGLALAAVDERPYDLGAASGDGAGFFGAEVVRSGAALRVDDAANDDPRFNAAFGAERLPGVDVRRRRRRAHPGRRRRRRGAGAIELINPVVGAELDDLALNDLVAACAMLPELLMLGASSGFACEVNKCVGAARHHAAC